MVIITSSDIIKNKTITGYHVNNTRTFHRQIQKLFDSS